LLPNLKLCPKETTKQSFFKANLNRGTGIGLAFLVAFQSPRKERILFVYGNLICRVTSVEKNKESIDDRKAKK